MPSSFLPIAGSTPWAFKKSSRLPRSPNQPSTTISGSKEGLVKTLIDRGFVVLDGALDQVGRYENDLPPYLERQASAWMGLVKVQPDWFRLELSLTFLPEENASAALVRTGVLSLQRRMETLFEQASLQYGNMKGRHRLLAAGWLGTLNHWTASSWEAGLSPMKPSFGREHGSSSMGFSPEG